MTDSVYFPLGELAEAVFIKRENRFRAEVELNGQIVKAHVPNSGRMQELLVPGTTVWVQPAKPTKTPSKTKTTDGRQTERKTACTLVLVQQGARFVCLHAHLANEIAAFWLAHDILPEFAGCTGLAREKKLGDSRMDFQLYRDGVCCYAEVKSVNLLVGSTARFPDAPTARGKRHLEELMAVKAQGMDAAVIFLVMGNAATAFAPNIATDPDFAEALSKAQQQGVEVYVYTCEINLEGVRFTGRIPVQEESEWKSMH